MRWMLVLLAVVAVSCVDGRYGRPGDRPPAGDGGPTPIEPIEPPPAPPGGVSLAVGGAFWSFDQSSLGLNGVVANAADGAPAPLVWTAFTLETDGGAILDADFDSAESCPGGVSVAPGATLSCGISFVLPFGHTPVRLHYRADAERTAQAPVTACSPSSPMGLCDAGMYCTDGRCAAPCSPEVPDGDCSYGLAELADYQCIEGECRLLCSADAPTGFCAEGTCNEGLCDTSCYSIDASASGCYACLTELVDAGLCTGGSADVTCNDVEACGQCPIGGQSVCECASTFECGGCEAEVRGLWDCMVRACPSCRG